MSKADIAYTTNNMTHDDKQQTPLMQATCRLQQRAEWLLGGKASPDACAAVQPPAHVASGCAGRRHQMLGGMALVLVLRLCHAQHGSAAAQPRRRILAVISLKDLIVKDGHFLARIRILSLGAPQPPLWRAPSTTTSTRWRPPAHTRLPAPERATPARAARGSGAEAPADSIFPAKPKVTSS